MLRLFIAFIFCMVGLFQPDAMSCVSTSDFASEFDAHTICDKTTRTSFTPVAKVTDVERYTIVNDYLGTPTQAYDSEGNLVWEMLLDVYGEVMESRGDRSLVPFRYQGQYEDEETGLYYNRFRYYSPEMGMYISSDPIGLAGNNPTLYGYVQDVNTWLDVWGLYVFYVLKQGETVIYYGITDRNIETRLQEHVRDGRTFDNVSYLDNLPDRISARDLEGSALHNARGSEHITNATRKHGGFYHSYDPDHLKPGRTYYTDAEIAEKLKNANKRDVDHKGKFKSCS